MENSSHSSNEEGIEVSIDHYLGDTKSKMDRYIKNPSKFNSFPCD
ncbi:hypothetical protein [Aestuariivivens sediminis]|nr:hypothetical protein [Aestuariivivens sediminis]